MPGSHATDRTLDQPAGENPSSAHSATNLPGTAGKVAAAKAPRRWEQSGTTAGIFSDAVVWAIPATTDHCAPHSVQQKRSANMPPTRGKSPMLPADRHSIRYHGPADSPPGVFVLPLAAVTLG